MELGQPAPIRTGNRLALAGAIIYLLEFAFIIPSGVRVPPEGSGPAEIAAAYGAQAPGIPFMAAGLFLVLLGRIAFSAGLRNALRQTNETRALGDFALGAMAASVVIEVIGEAVRFTTSRLAAQGADPALLAALHETWRSVGFAIPPALGASIASASLAMLLSREFPRWLAAFGLVTGVAWIGSGFYGTLNNTIPGVAGFAAWLAWVAWLLTTGVILFRRAGPLRAATSIAT
jgi:hypothetical protein